MILLVAVTVAGLFLPESAASSFCGEAGYHQIWSDEFDAPTLDNRTWTPQVTAGGSDTRTAHGTLDNVWVENGTLVMRTTGSWDGNAWANLTTGAVQSNGKRSFKAGGWGGNTTRVCVSAKLPGGGGNGRGAGIWPAHWLMPDKPGTCWPCAGEIDIMEMINGDGLARGTYHWSRQNKSSDDQQTQWWQRLPIGWGDVFHEFAVEYDGVSTIKFAVDGHVYKTVDKFSRSLPGLQPVEFFDVPYYLILNTAVGGAWPKPPTRATVFPTYHSVDYVRVAQKPGPACPKCACNSPTIWPVSGCDVVCGAKCPNQGCCYV